MKKGEYRENRCWVVDGVAYIDLSTPRYPQAVTLIDTDDIALVLDGCGRWRRSKTGYAWRWSSKRFVFLHRHLLGLTHGDRKTVDHANADGLDNRRSNIRLATPSQNLANKRRLSPLPHLRGVRIRPSGRWEAHIRIDGRWRFLGTHATELEAAQAYDDAALAHYGEFARLNSKEV